MSVSRTVSMIASHSHTPVRSSCVELQRVFYSMCCASCSNPPSRSVCVSVSFGCLKVIFGLRKSAERRKWKMSSDSSRERANTSLRVQKLGRHLMHSLCVCTSTYSWLFLSLQTSLSMSNWIWIESKIWIEFRSTAAERQQRLEFQWTNENVDSERKRAEIKRLKYGRMDVGSPRTGLTNEWRMHFPAQFLPGVQ